MSYVWFGPEAVQELKRRLNAAPDSAILKFENRPVWGKKENWVVDVEVPNATKVLDDDPINDSHVCPIFCP